MKNFNPFKSFFIVVIFISASCSQIIDIDIPEHEPVWTLSGNISAGEAFYEIDSTQRLIIPNFFVSVNSINFDDINSLTLSKSIPISNRRNEPDFFDDGELLIFQGDNLVEAPTASVDNLFNSKPRYVSEHNYEPEMTYLFKMTTNDDTELTATQTIPKKVEPRNVRFNESNTEIIVNFTIDDAPRETNHYLFQCHEVFFSTSGGNSWFNYNKQEFNIASPNFFWYYEDFDFLDEGSPYRFTGVLSDVDFNGQSHEIEIRINKDVHSQGMSPNKKIIIEISSMSLEMHRYFQSYAQTIFGFSPFSEPAILNFNVENGLGAVVAATTTFLEIEQ